MNSFARFVGKHPNEVSNKMAGINLIIDPFVPALIKQTYIAC